MATLATFALTVVLEIDGLSSYLLFSIFIKAHTMASTNPMQFIQQVRSEVSKVVWPTRREVLLTTVMVFILSALTATFFSLVDVAIRYALTLIVAGT